METQYKSASLQSISTEGTLAPVSHCVELIRHGYPAINVKFADRKRYYNAFDSFYRDNDPEPMINLVAEYVSERYDDYFRILDSN